MTKARLSSSRLPASLSIGGGDGAIYDKTGGATIAAVASGAVSMRRRMRLVPSRPVAAIHTKSGGAIAQASASGAHQIDHLRSGQARAGVVGAGFHGRTLRPRVGGATMQISASSELHVTRGEHLDLADLLALGAITLDDLFALDDVPEWLIEEALALA
jgi:hypothetical protein